MRKIIDSSFLQDPELETFLRRSTNNHAILTDYAALEAYKSDDLTSIYQSMKVVSKFPNQVLVLKATPKICELRGHASGLQRRMIDLKHTQSFRKSRRDWRHPKASLSLEGQIPAIQMRQAASQEQLNIIEGRARDIIPMIDEIAGMFTKDELKIIRQHDAEYTDGIVKKLLYAARLHTDEFLKAYPHIRKYASDRELVNSYVFRHSLCTHLFILKWLSVGGTKSSGDPEKIRNHMVDIYFAAYATFFDGLLTRDKRLQTLYEEAQFIIPRIRV